MKGPIRGSGDSSAMVAGGICYVAFSPTIQDDALAELIRDDVFDRLEINLGHLIISFSDDSVIIRSGSNRAVFSYSEFQGLF